MPSNYIDPDETRPLDLGPCRCPVEPAPHVRDQATIVKRFGYGDRMKVREATSGSQANMIAILLGTKTWNLVLKNGNDRPISPVQVALLDQQTVEALIADDALGAAMEDDPLPNAPSAPSPDGSQESAGITPTMPSPTPPSLGSTST